MLTLTFAHRQPRRQSTRIVVWILGALTLGALAFHLVGLATALAGAALAVAYGRRLRRT